MAFSSFLKTINAPAGTGNQAYTGVGFQPKVILFFGCGLGADTTTGVHAVADFGVGISSSSQRAISFIGDDGDKAHTKAKYHSDTSCFIQTTNAAALLINASLVTMDADGFTLNFIATSSGARIHCLCLGGSHLTNVALETILTPGSTGNQSYTGAGFQPDQVVAFSVGHNVAPPSGSTGGSVMSLGFASSTSAQFGTGYFSSDSSDNTDCARVQDNRIILIPNSNGTGLHTAGTLDSFDATGCTINWQTITAANMRWFLLYLKGGKHAVGSILQKTTTGTQSTGNIEIIPNGVFNISSQQTALNTVQQGSYLTIGATTSTSNRATIWAGEQDQTGDSVTDRSSDTTKMIGFLTEGTPTLLATADLSSFTGPSGITYNWTTADANARYIGYWAFSESLYEEASGGAVCGGSAHVTPVQVQTCQSAGTGASDNSNAGNVAWSTPENIVSSNDSYATISTSDGEFTEYIKATNFGFSLNIDAEIVGIAVNVEKRCGSDGTSNNYIDAEAFIVKGGTIQTAENKALAGKWATTDTVYTYGGENDLWGVTWTASDINASNFGFVLSGEDTGGQNSRVDHIQICVTYIPVIVADTATGGGAVGGSATVQAVYNLNDPKILPGTECGPIGTCPIGGEPIGGSPTDSETPWQTFYGALCSGTAGLVGNTYTYDETGSGGATCGGTALVHVDYNITASGGATCGGTAPFLCVHNFTGSGGAVCAGTTTLAATYNISGTGGATCSGTSSVNAVYSITATDGAVCGGTLIVSQVTDKTTSGGVICAGTVSFQTTYNEMSSSGVVCNGAATTLFIYNIHPANGAIVGGTTGVTSNVGDIATGGAIVEGSAIVTYRFEQIATGGAICNGAAIDQIVSTYSETGTGGIVCGGSGSTVNTFGEVATGGAICGGMSSTNHIHAEFAMGGVVCDGASTVQRITSTIAAGGAICNGSAIDQIVSTYSETGTGGVVCGGTGSTLNVYGEIATGGVVCGGTTTISKVSTLIATNGCIVSGIGTNSLIFRPMCSGGTVVSGTTQISIICHQIALGGVVCSGDADLFHLVAGQSGSEFVLEFIKPSSLYIMGQRRMFKLPVKAAKQHSSSMYQDRTSPLERI